MPATITATGTWTPLNIDLTRMGKTSPNVLHADMMQLEQLKAVDPSEFTQFIQAIADGYGINFNPALALFFAWVQARMNKENPTVSRAYQP
jgi:hypothetical protein